MRHVVLGAGRQGLAIAWDLAVRGGAAEVVLVDADGRTARDGVRRLHRLVPGARFSAVEKDLARGHLAPLLRGAACVTSAVPFHLNARLATESVRAGASFCDLGGHTGVVREELGLAGAARAKGVAVVPDCGLAPGLGNELASVGLRAIVGARHVRIRCGGLPETPVGPLGYTVVFSVEGLVNEYRGEAEVIRDGRLRRIEAFTDCERFRGPRGLGPLEAFLTSGGTSTATTRLRGKVATYDYKTVRYRGHFEKVRTMIDLGLLDATPVTVDGRPVSPRAVFRAAVGPRLARPDVRDLVILRVEVTRDDGSGVRYDLLQRHDDATGFSAMEQATGFPAALIAEDLAHGRIRPGARTAEALGHGEPRLHAWRARGLPIVRRTLRPRG